MDLNRLSADRQRVGCADDYDEAVVAKPRPGLISRFLRHKAITGQQTLSEVEFRAMLKRYGIPVTETVVAATDWNNHRRLATFRQREFDVVRRSDGVVYLSRDPGNRPDLKSDSGTLRMTDESPVSLPR